MTVVMKKRRNPQEVWLRVKKQVIPREPTSAPNPHQRMGWFCGADYVDLKTSQRMGQKNATNTQYAVDETHVSRKRVFPRVDFVMMHN
eukprot:TRINITY_DN15223_c0_g1_i1.p1 TRINITY_DN15223_c0_g1~~TRINITY_DN15223_c0_g1_i1.p1  ORF type:complete len:102 (-),score=11.31 TRINITY_DN15223_c0_g1_i1:100-363(-)